MTLWCFLYQLCIYFLLALVNVLLLVQTYSVCAFYSPLPLAALVCRWRTDCLEIWLCLSHQKLWIVVDKRLPVVFLRIFHPKMFHKLCFSFKASWEIDFPLLYKRKGYSPGHVTHLSFSWGHGQTWKENSATVPRSDWHLNWLQLRHRVVIWAPSETSSNLLEFLKIVSRIPSPQSGHESLPWFELCTFGVKTGVFQGRLAGLYCFKLLCSPSHPEGSSLCNQRLEFQNKL